tara:strand:- start:339 stop:587 length:249 start_codon:yes stop_codon:yes gene_type:complete
MVDNNKKKQPPLVTLEGVEYFQEDLNEHQILLTNHIADLDRKIASTTFNLQQFNFGRKAFDDALAASIQKTNSEKENKKDAD